MKASILAAAALALFGAACAKPADSVRQGSKGPAVVLAAAGETQKAGSSKVSMTIAMSAAGKSFVMQGDGVMDFLSQLGSLDFAMSGKDMPDEMSQMKFTMLFAKGVMYMKIPEGIPGLDASRPWVKIDVAKAAGDAGLNMPGFGGFGGAGEDPTAMLTFTKNAEDIQSVGSEDVRGTQTTHYTMSIDMKKALDQVATKDSPVTSMFAKAGFTSLPAELWVDDAGKVRRMKASLDMGKLAGAAGGAGSEELAGATMTMTMEFYDFGAPVDVTVPADDQVQDTSEVTARASA